LGRTRMSLRSHRIFAAAAILVAIMSAGCVLPTVSLHSFRDVKITLTEADSGKPVAWVPFRVQYKYYPADSPIVYHWELRTPKEVQATTDVSGQALIKVADYAWDTLLYVSDKERRYFATFVLSKELIRKGGTVQQLRSSLRSKHWGEYPELRVELQPVRTPNSQGGANRRQPSPPVNILESPAAASRRSP
jgi:hypothetical protein